MAAQGEGKSPAFSRRNDMCPGPGPLLEWAGTVWHPERDAAINEGIYNTGPRHSGRIKRESVNS